MPRIWCQLIQDNRMIEHQTIEIQPAPLEEQLDQALTEVCHALDLSKPIVLPHHVRDFEKHHRARFLPEQFIDSVSFDRMEVELILDEKNKKR